MKIEIATGKKGKAVNIKKKDLTDDAYADWIPSLDQSYALNGSGVLSLVFSNAPFIAPVALFHTVFDDNSDIDDLEVLDEESIEDSDNSCACEQCFEEDENREGGANNPIEID